MFTSTNPATGETIATYPELDDAGLEARLARAATAYRGWRSASIAERTSLLTRVAGAYAANVDRLARMATCEMGKTLKEAAAEVEKCEAAFRYYAEAGPAMLEPSHIRLSSGGQAEARWLPQGPILAVMPWNFPYWQAVRFLAPTILAGNVALLKHAAIVQGVAGLMEEMMEQAGAPEGLFQNLAIGAKRVAGVIGDGRVVAVTLTGSEAAGRSVAEAAGRCLKKVVLELGGSDPFVVMPSADLDAAAKAAAKARTQNAGQSCICAKRMIVHRDIYDAFLVRFAAAMRAVTPGDPLDAGSDIGPLSSAEQRDTVVRQIDTAKKEGARLAVGGEAGEGQGAFLSPGILVEVPRDGAIAKEELFGPVAMLFRANDLEDAIDQANAVPFGLGASIWTSDDGERERLIAGIESGMVAVNRMLASAPEAPFGGIKNSGHGRELGPWGLHAFMNLKTVFDAA